MPLIQNPSPPSTDEVRIAKESSRKLAPAARKKNITVQIQIASASRAPEVIDLPSSAVQLLLKILTEMGEGNAVTLTPIHAHLTTQQAADLLGVSRPFLIKEIKAGKLKFQMVGTHRRIQYKDLMAYKEKLQSDHNRAMDELVAQAQELNMGY